MYEIVRQLDVDFILRAGTVDHDNLNWMVNSPFINIVAEQELDSNDMLIDFGSHIGSWSLPLSKRFGCRSWCFEPEKESLLISRASAVLNQLDSQISFFEAGIAGRDGKVALYESDETWGHTMVQGGGPYNRLTGHSVEVDVMSLATALELVSGQGRMIVKINIEGAEYDMFEDASVDTLKEVDLWVGEIHYDLGREDFRPYIDKLKLAGFAVSMLPAGDRREILVARKR
ncbi:FkbM family methyltransferase [Cyanobium sp. ATX 6A2]|uniref:FkbM family methyltransferase n=1 Tax=Cyanobium sp. ATX 6A2 TaxID=2823700 RepID=UPI0020CDAA5E|nr:FkbM family methyltransferase [Cyanobium sp. ATX 6A2]MCP9889421.1 FkbM family methyltransferase [Cyanobium sp. ATX 6A2]